jgi:hypothetical protein
MNWGTGLISIRYFSGLGMVWFRLVLIEGARRSR